ncbi:MAG TPA: IS21 family transposase [Gemmatimonadales bacterium]|nr:IS21 family transposase [Gemmatimonadales bacterium]
MIDVEHWADIRRMHFIDGVSIREIHRRSGLHRETIRRALASKCPPAYRREKAPSKLDPFKEEIERLLRSDHRLPGTRIRELIEELGYEGGRTILDDHLREVRPRFTPRRTYQRTVYRPGEICQFDLWEPRAEIPVGHGQTRRAWVVTCALGFSRAGTGALIFAKQAHDILWGMSRCLAGLGALPETVVWDREAAIAPRGRPTDAFAAFCGALPVGWSICQAADPESKGVLERSHRYLRSNFEPGRAFASPGHFQGELDAWFQKANSRLHRGIRAVPAERLAEEKGRMRPLPERMPETDRRFVTRVPQQPYLRLDTNDYSLDPRAAGRRVEVRASQREITAVELGTGARVASHRRSFAKGLTFTDPAHQILLDRLRGERRRGPAVEVETRPLARYDELIPA